MRLKNASYLHVAAVLRRVAHRLLSVIAPEQSLVTERIVSRAEVAALIGEPAWITAGSSPTWGVAVLFQGLSSPGSAWAGARAALHVASAVRSELGSGVYGEGRLILTPGAPPDGWVCIEVTTQSGSLMCAGVFSHLARVHSAVTPTRTIRAGIFLRAYCSEVRIGEHIALGRSLSAEVPDLNVLGVVRSSGYTKSDGVGGTVIMTVMAEPEAVSDESKAIAVRIDLGSLELSVAEVAALKPGAQIEIDGTFPAECFLRVGSTVLGRGILEAHDDGFSLRIEQVFE